MYPVYFGDIGQDSAVLVDYLERNGAKVPGDANPAEFMLEAIGAGSRKRIGGDWHEKWKNSPEFKATLEQIEILKRDALAQPVNDNAKHSECKLATLTQLTSRFDLFPYSVQAGSQPK